MRTNANGDSLWSRSFGAGGDAWCVSLRQTADGGFALTGYTTSFGVGWSDFWLLQTDAEGDSIWSRTFGGRTCDWCYSLIQTADGGVAMAGCTRSFGAGNYDFWLVRTDVEGDSLWSRNFGGRESEWCNSLIQTADGGFALGGNTYSFGAGDYDFWLVRIDENGDSLWSRTFGGGAYDRCNSLIQTADGGLVMAGRTSSFGAGNDDFWLVKTGPDPVSAPPESFIPHPLSFILLEAFPNPFNRTLTVLYQAERPGEMWLEAVDPLGRRVALLQRSITTAGTHRIHWNADGLSSGRYTIILGDNQRTLDSKGVMLLR